jgi:hypothetical protein
MLKKVSNQGAEFCFFFFKSAGKFCEELKQCVVFLCEISTIFTNFFKN